MSDTSNRYRLLVVDDDADLCKLLSMRLKAAGYLVKTAASGEAALNIMPEFNPQLVLTDLRMGGMQGMELFRLIAEKNPSLPVIIMTAHGSIPDAVKATQEGVFGYLTKPLDSEQLLDYIKRGLQPVFAGDKGAASEDAGAWRSHIVSRSAAMEALLDQARRVAASDVRILVQGESGTGKELLARAVHNASPRRDGPFIALNCSAIPEQLLESELFGHEKGAFTGATGRRKGLFLEAQGGTIFLDEIGDMPFHFQSKLLRTLQENEIRPVGADTAYTVDVRVISATHKDLAQAMEQNEFREDLYYRLNVVTLELPPLRERREDIPLLVNHFLAHIADRMGESPRKFAPDALALLVKATWPGNIRQLQNVVEQSAVLSTSQLIPEAVVQKALKGDSSEWLSLAEARDRFDRDYLIKLLQLTEGNVSKAAKLADRNRTELYKLFSRHELDPELFRPSATEDKA